MRTNLNSYPISFLNEQNQLKNLNLQPKYQRRLVWPFKNKVYLIDTILQGLPLPKFFVELKVEPSTGKTIYEMVDGQQRLSTILEFIKGTTSDNKEFILSEKNHPKPETFNSELEGLSFATLPSQYQQRLWGYQLSMEELVEANDAEIRDMFVRLNLNNVKLKDQELRNALYHGDFKKLVYEIAEEYGEDYFLRYKLLSVARIKRMDDAEFTSELFGSMLRGLTNKKDKIDEFYRDYDDMDPDLVAKIKKEFRSIMRIIEDILGEDLRTTRFNNRTDFHSLFHLFYSLIYEEKLKIDSSSFARIKLILIKLSLEIKDDSQNPTLQQYYINTVNAGDTLKNRKFRHDYLYDIIRPLCIERDPKRLFSEREKQFLWHTTEDKKCGICLEIINEYSECEIDHIDAWSNGGRTDISNGQIAHSICNKSKSAKNVNNT